MKSQNKKDEPFVLKEIKKGILKKRNEWYIQQERTFLLTNEPTLKYYRNETILRVNPINAYHNFLLQGEIRLSKNVYARRNGRDRFEIVTPGRVYFLREIKAGDSDSWIQAINDAIFQKYGDK